MTTFHFNATVDFSFVSEIGRPIDWLKHTFTSLDTFCLILTWRFDWKLFDDYRWARSDGPSQRSWLSCFFASTRLDKPASVDDEQPKTTVDNDNNNNNEEGGQSNDEQDKTTDGQSSEETGSKEDQPSKSDAEQSNASKAKFNWLPIIIVVAAFVGLLLLGVIFFVIQQRKKQNGSPVPNEEPPIN